MIRPPARTTRWLLIGLGGIAIAGLSMRSRIADYFPEPMAVGYVAEKEEFFPVREDVAHSYAASMAGRSTQAGIRVEKGYASTYGAEFDGRLTASGEVFHKNSVTAAHRKLPFGTWVTVKNLNNGQEVRVRINNRGPFVKGRVIDVSEKAARELGMIRAGVVPVEISVDADAPPARK